MEYVFATFGTMTLEGGPIFWVATHRSITSFPMSGDPHSRGRRFLVSHGLDPLGRYNHRNTKMLAGTRRISPSIATTSG
jgi:stearoyl-CoA desaturase (delta-9 desaturase)